MFAPNGRPELPPPWNRRSRDPSVVRLGFAMVLFAGVCWGSWVVRSNWDGHLRLIQDGVWADLESRFWRQTVTESFRSRLLSVQTTRGTILEVATSRGTERITRRSDLLWPGSDVAIPGGEAETEVLVPAVFRYHVALDGAWRVRMERDGTLDVVAPPMLPTLPVAFDSSGWSTRSGGGPLSVFRRGQEAAELNGQITRTLADRAAASLVQDEVRASGRRAVAGFVRDWVTEEGQWGGDRVVAIRVRFPDEVERPVEAIPPTLVADLEDQRRADLERGPWRWFPDWLTGRPEIARAKAWVAAGMAGTR